MYRFVMIFAEEISLPKDQRCLRFKCDSFYELNAVNPLPVHDLSAVNDCILRFKYSSTAGIRISVLNGKQRKRLDPPEAPALQQRLRAYRRRCGRGRCGRRLGEDARRILR